MIRVTIVEPNEFLRSGFKTSLEAETDLQVVGEFGTGTDAVEELKDLDTHVVLLSVDLPDAVGYRVCIEILEVAPQVRIIMMTTQLRITEIATSMTAGSAGCLPKDCPSSDLIRTVQANGNGEMLYVRSVAELSMAMFQYNRMYVDLESLTDREKQVLILAANGMTNTGIGERLGISEYTVRNHVRSLFRKLNVTSRAQLGAYGATVGLMSIDEVKDW